MAGAHAASPAAPQHKRRHAAEPDQPEARRLPWGLGSAAAGYARQEAAGNRLSSRNFDAGRAEEDGSLCHSYKAKIAASAADPGRAIGHLGAIEQRQVSPHDDLHHAVQIDQGLRALDAREYGAVLVALKAIWEKS